MNENKNESRNIWVIWFVGFDDDRRSNRIQPKVGFERIESSGSADQMTYDAELAALLRGGELLAIVEQDDQEKAAALAAQFEREILRTR